MELAPPGRALVRASLLIGIIAGPPAALAASFPPHLRFQSVSTARVTVHYHQGLEAMAREAAGLATELLDAHERRYGGRVGRVQVVLADVEDDPNGFASPLPYPLVHVRAVAPDGTDEFGNYEGWLRLVLSHELAHIVHLERAGGIVRLGRKVFGRAPFLFPNGSSPTWLIEGLATYEETEATAFGRGRSADARMVLRMAALEAEFPKEDRPVLGLDRWPDGLAPYLYGEAYLRDLTRKHGPATLPELVRVQGGRPIPYTDELTARRVTGTTHHALWSRFRAESKAEFQAEAARIEAAGLTPARPLTQRGYRQTSPRFSPDGSWLAYTSRAPARQRAVRLVRPDGTGDRRLVDRNGGAALAWTPDGRTIVFDEPEVHGLFTTRSDLRAVDVASGRRRRLTRGVRASEPDVAPDGRRIVFVRQTGERSELALIQLDGSGLRDLTTSAAGTQWSGPAWSPSGAAIVAARWTSGGFLDLVAVDPSTGLARPLTTDRARDVEPAWTPDGAHVVFRSDRDGVSNLYALRLADGRLVRVTNVVGGAFAPDVAPDGRTVAFAAYSARGYDIATADLDLDTAGEAPPFVDTYPQPRPAAAPADGAARGYRPLPMLRPRFWAPYAGRFGGDTRAGFVTGGADALLRHAWGLDAHFGFDSSRPGVQGFYQYDRLRPTLLLAAQHLHENVELRDGPARLRVQELLLRATLPLVRRLRQSQSLSLTWRRERQVVEDGPSAGAADDLGGFELAWTLSTALRHPYSISPVDGHRLRLAYVREAPALGGDLTVGKLLADARVYARVFGERDVLALHAGGGATFGEPGLTRSFAVGGFPEGGLLDLFRTSHAVLRGYPDQAFTGRSFLAANAEYRFPLAHPQRGFRTMPLFLRHLHGAVFADAAQAWTGTLRLRDVKAAAGVALGADLYVGHALPLTATFGVARGFAARGDTRVYFRTGLSF